MYENFTYLISLITITLTLLTYALPYTKFAFYHGIRIQRIWLSTLTVALWFTLALTSSSTEIFYVTPTGTPSLYSIDTSPYSWLFGGIAIIQMIFTFVLIIEHVNEEAEEFEEMIEEGKSS